MKPTSAGRAGSTKAGRPASTRPMKSFFVDIILPRPKSAAQVWPLSSPPAAWPFSTRIIAIASVP